MIQTEPDHRKSIFWIALVVGALTSTEILLAEFSADGGDLGIRMVPLGM